MSVDIERLRELAEKAAHIQSSATEKANHQFASRPCVMLALLDRLEAAEREKKSAVVRMHRISCEQHSCIDIRSRQGLGGRQGIGVGCDEASLHWQELEADREELLGNKAIAEMVRDQLEENRRKAEEASND